VPLPQLSDEQRRAALEKAAEIRKARSELKEQLKTGHMTLTKVLDRAETDVMVGKLKVTELLKSMPGIGKVKAMQIMDRLKISDSRRLRGLGNQQRQALLDEFAVNGARTVRAGRSGR
jgi:hypothetical protein